MLHICLHRSFSIRYMPRFFSYSMKYISIKILICREEINPFVHFISIRFLIVVNSNYNDDGTNKLDRSSNVSRDRYKD